MDAGNKSLSDFPRHYQLISVVSAGATAVNGDLHGRYMSGGLSRHHYGTHIGPCGYKNVPQHKAYVDSAYAN